MRIQRVQNNDCNTQFKGVLTLYDNTYINPERIKQNIPKSADKKLHDVISKILDESQRSYSLSCGNGMANKKDFAKFINIINKLLQLDPVIIKMDDSRWAVPYCYSYCNDANDESQYSINLNKRFSIKHEFNRKDVANPKGNQNADTGNTK